MAVLLTFFGISAKIEESNSVTAAMPHTAYNFDRSELLSLNIGLTGPEWTAAINRGYWCADCDDNGIKMPVVPMSLPFGRLPFWIHQEPGSRDPSRRDCPHQNVFGQATRVARAEVVKTLGEVEFLNAPPNAADHKRAPEIVQSGFDLFGESLLIAHEVHVEGCGPKNMVDRTNYLVGVCGIDHVAWYLPENVWMGLDGEKCRIAANRMGIDLVYFHSGWLTRTPFRMLDPLIGRISSGDASAEQAQIAAEFFGPKSGDGLKRWMQRAMFGAKSAPKLLQSIIAQWDGRDAARLIRVVNHNLCKANSRNAEKIQRLARGEKQ